MEIVTSYMMTAFFTSSMGSLVRIAHDSDVKLVNLKKGLLVYICAMSTGYICYELAVYFTKSWIVGVPSLILALGAVEITRVIKNTLGWVVEKILKAVPGLVVAAARRALNLPPEGGGNNGRDSYRRPEGDFGHEGYNGADSYPGRENEKYE